MTTTTSDGEVLRIIADMLALERVHDADMQLRCKGDLIYAMIMEHGQTRRISMLTGLRVMMAEKYASEMQGKFGGSAERVPEFRRLFDGVFSGIARTDHVSRIMQLALFFASIYIEPAIRDFLCPAPPEQESIDRETFELWCINDLKGLFEAFQNGAIGTRDFALQAAVSYCSLQPGNPIVRPGRSAANRLAAHRRLGIAAPDDTNNKTTLS